MTTQTETREKRYDNLTFGRYADGEKNFGSAIGFVSPKNIRVAKDGDIRSFGVPLENVQGRVAAMFPDDFDRADVPETVWLNVTMFNNENYKLADRLEKAVEGKNRVRIRVSGDIKVTEYNGKKTLEMTASSFHILWADTYKGTNVGGGEDGHSYIDVRKVEEGKGHIVTQGFVSRPELRQLDDGRNVLNFGIPVDKADKSINYALGTEFPAGETIWLDVSIFDNDHFPQALQAAKVVRSGAALALQGYASVEEYTDKDGNTKKTVRLNVNDFEVLKFAPREGEEGNNTAIQDNVTTTQVVDESPFDDNADFDFDDDDLPF